MRNLHFSTQQEHIAMGYITEIAIDGKATVVAVPDTISLLIRMSAKAPSYADTVQKLNEGARKASDTLAECKILSQAQTREYSVDEDWQHQYDDAKRKFIGYVGVQQLVVEFPIDMNVLCNVLQGLGATEIKPSVNTYFEVKDQTAIIQEARQKALQAATATAHQMATQMGLSIVGVKSVQYSMTREAAPHSLHVAFEGESLAKMSYSMPEIIPEEVSNTVNVSGTWIALA
jgi:uncharacterized protein YggE